jgi:hypothetical protein
MRQWKMTALHHSLLALMALLFIATACVESDNGTHGTFGDNPNGEKSTQASTFSGASCAAVPAYSSVYAGQSIPVTITVYGLAAPYTISPFGSFTTNPFQIVGQIPNNTSGAITLTPTVTVSGANGQTVSCVFSSPVTVQPGTGGTLGCSISISETPSTVAPATFTITAYGGNGNYSTQLGFYDASDLEPAPAVNQNGSIATANVVMNHTGSWTATATVDSGAYRTNCQTTFNVSN